MIRSGRDLALLGVLALLPIVAFAPAWSEGRLLGPGDAPHLHFPLRVAVFRAYEAREIPSWNPGIFSGTPLLASYRAGALHPLSVVLSWLPEFIAFQALVLGSLALAAVALYLYLRALGANRVGAYTGGLLFGLGPLLCGGLGDTALVAAAPMAVLLLLALERQLHRPSFAAALFTAGALALVLLAGSPEVSWAGLLLAGGRLLVHRIAHGPDPLGAAAAARALGCGLLLAAPQLVPTLLALRGAGPATTAGGEVAILSGFAGLLVRYVSHTPAPALALAALPLLFKRAVRGFTLAFVLALPVCVIGGGLEASAGRVVLDLASCVLAGLVVSEHGAARLDERGRRLRAYVLLAALGSAAALSIATTLAGPLPQLLAGALGVLAVAFILFLSLGGSQSFVRSHLFLLPLTVSLLLQPHGRGLWASAPTEAELYSGSSTRAALDRAMLARRDERSLSLVRAWPAESAFDLGYAGLAAMTGRRSANGVDPLVPAVRRAAFDGMTERGLIPEALLRTDPGRLEFLGVRFVEALAKDLVVSADSQGLGDALDVVLDPARPRYFPLPITAASEIRIESALSDSVLVTQDAPVAFVTLRLASGRTLPLPVRAGVDTAEWAYDRSDVTARMRHRKAHLSSTLGRSAAGETGLRYLGVLKLQGRYLVDGAFVEAVPGRGRLSLFRMGLVDEKTGRAVGVSLASGYLSDAGRFREAAATPLVRLMELRASLGRARVVDGARRFRTESDLLAALRAPLAAGIDPRRDALVTEDDTRGLVIPEGARTSRAVVSRSTPSTVELRAEGPGLLVVTEGWDAGWGAEVDGRARPVFKANGTHLAVVLDAGTHRVRLVHHARGLREGLVLAGLGASALLAFARRRGALTPSKSAS